MSDILIPIPQELFATAESLHFEGKYDLGVMEAGPDTYTFSEPLAWQADITNTGEALLVAGTVEGVGVTACARCGEPATIELAGDIEGYFLIHPNEEGAEEGEEDEFDVLPENHEIDLGDLMNQALLIELPLIPLCDEDCLGLCPQCGANLNEGPCECGDKKAVDPLNPFAALADFTVEE